MRKMETFSAEVPPVSKDEIELTNLGRDTWEA